MITARMHIPLGPGPDRLAALENLLNVQAEANAVWFQEHPDAPCCAACAGVRYYDPPVGKCQNFWSAPDVLRRGKASCADAAAYEAGAKLAKGHRATVVLEDVDGVSMHAVAYVDGVRIDPSAELAGSPNRVQPRCAQPGTVANVGHGYYGAMAVGSPIMIPGPCPNWSGTPGWLPPKCNPGGCGVKVGCGCASGCGSKSKVGNARGTSDHRGRRFAVGRGQRFATRSPSVPPPPGIRIPPPSLPPPPVPPRPFEPGEPISAHDFWHGRRVTRSASQAIKRARRFVAKGAR